MPHEPNIAISVIVRSMYGRTPHRTRRLTSDRRSRIAGDPRRRLKSLIAAALLLIGTDCAGQTDGRPTGETTLLPAAEARLGVALPDFGDAPGTHSRYRSEDGRLTEEFAEWRLADGTTAGLALSTARTGAPFTDPALPSDILPVWPQFRNKRPNFGNPATAETELGPVPYQRVAIGTWACVLFLRRWLTPDARVAAEGQAVLLGYYCNPPGVLLAPDAAQTVLRAIVLHSPRS